MLHTPRILIVEDNEMSRALWLRLLQDWEYDPVGARDGEKLHLIIYTGAAIYYYDRYIETVERLVASIRT